MTSGIHSRDPYTTVCVLHLRVAEHIRWHNMAQRGLELADVDLPRADKLNNEQQITYGIGSGDPDVPAPSRRRRTCRKLR